MFLVVMCRPSVPSTMLQHDSWLRNCELVLHLLSRYHHRSLQFACLWWMGWSGGSLHSTKSGGCGLSLCLPTTGVHSGVSSDSVMKHTPGRPTLSSNLTLKQVVRSIETLSSDSEPDDSKGSVSGAVDGVVAACTRYFNFSSNYCPWMVGSGRNIPPSNLLYGPLIQTPSTIWLVTYCSLIRLQKGSHMTSMECNYQYAAYEQWWLLQRPDLTPKSSINFRNKALLAARLLPSLLDVMVKFYLMCIIIAIIAFLWDALVQPFWLDPFSIFRRRGWEWDWTAM